MGWANPRPRSAIGQVGRLSLRAAVPPLRGDTDRTVRKEAFEIWAKLYESISESLDDIYSQLIRVRLEMAENLGFSSYTEMAYIQQERYEYGPEEVEKFREQVREVIVPLCQKLFDGQRERLGIDKLHYYDEALISPQGNAVPKGSADELVDKARQMYRELSEETGEFFDFMCEHALFDLETKEGKQQGGYCTMLIEPKAPFIFSNFNGTSADVAVLTHEAGHAFEAYTALRKVRLPEQVFAMAEITEIHSMAMELFTYPYMELFFGDDAQRYRREHLITAIQAIPYMVCVDEFQHRIYDEKVLDAKERRRVWKELEKKYLPWRDYDGNEFLEEGGFWMQKQHIFMCPFYYIQYAMAQFGALEYYVRMKEEPEEAWEDYYRLCCAGGTKGYFELLKEGNLSNPFEEETIRKIVEKLDLI